MYYIYKTTNILNNKIYIGMHKSEDIENDTYLGSGRAFIKALNKYGRNNFTREILFEFNTFEEALIKESVIVNTEFVKRRDTYNLTNGGKGMEHISGHNDNKICIYSPKTNKNHYINEDKLEEFLEGGWMLGNNSKGKICIKKENNIKYINLSKLKEYLLNGWIKSNTTHNKVCITHIETNKLKYVDPHLIDYYLNNGYSIGNKKSGVNKGTIYINKEQKNKRIDYNDLESYIKLGWVKGFFQVKEISKRMYNPLTNELRCIPLDKLEEYESNGWLYGNNYVTNKNKLYITKNKKNKRINIEELDVYLLNGWVKGMYNKKYDKSLNKK